MASIGEVIFLDELELKEGPYVEIFDNFDQDRPFDDQIHLVHALSRVRVAIENYHSAPDEHFWERK